MRPQWALRAVGERAYYGARHMFERARIARARMGPTPDWYGVRILGYHRVSDARDVLAVSPAIFRDQMELVAGSNATPIRLSEALDLLEEEVTERYVCITFDDGFLDNLENAVPILEEFELPATIFLPTDMIGNRSPYPWYRSASPPALKWAEVREIVAGGRVDVQAHGVTHRYLPDLSVAEARAEFVESKREIEAQVGHEVTIFCYPAGRFGVRETELLFECGFRAGVSTAPGINHGREPLATLRRTMIMWSDCLTDFCVKFDGRLDQDSRLRAWVHERRSRG